MATIPPVVTWAPSLGTETTHLNLIARIRNPIDFLKAVPLCVLRKNASQTLPNNTWTYVTWNVEDIDSDNGFTLGADNYVAQTAGWYLVTTSLLISGNGFGHRLVEFEKMGQLFGQHATVTNGSTQIAELSTSYYIDLQVGQTVGVRVHQDSGSTLNIVNDAGDSRFEIRWVRALS